MVSLTFAEQSGMMGQPGRIKSVEILREQGPKSGELLMHHDDTVAMLREVAAGKRTATLRIYQPNPTVAFGRRDELNPGFTAAAQACRDLGYDILVRKVGGHAAAYHTGCLVIDHFQPAEDAKTGNNLRYKLFGDMYAQALQLVGVDAAVGEIPQEYCPGEYSVYARLGGEHSGERIKLVGTAQRVIQGGWWFSTGIVVYNSASLREITSRVYDALGMPLNPATVGAAEDANPALLMEDLEDAILEIYAQNGFK